MIDVAGWGRGRPRASPHARGRRRAAGPRRSGRAPRAARRTATRRSDLNGDPERGRQRDGDQSTRGGIGLAATRGAVTEHAERNEWDHRPRAGRGRPRAGRPSERPRTRRSPTSGRPVGAEAICEAAVERELDPTQSSPRLPIATQVGAIRRSRRRIPREPRCGKGGGDDDRDEDSSLQARGAARMIAPHEHDLAPVVWARRVREPRTTTRACRPGRRRPRSSGVRCRRARGDRR